MLRSALAIGFENEFYRVVHSSHSIIVVCIFYTGVVFNVTHALVRMLIVVVISFLFTTVAANAIAIVGTNPVSV